MAKLRNWLRMKPSKTNATNKPPPKHTDDPSLPPPEIFLPERRLSLSLSPNNNNKNIENAFFTTLPPEIRAQIYIFAFGHRTIHIDLQYRAPHPVSENPYDHAGIASSVAQSSLDLDCHWHDEVDQAACRWRWWSSVCHRNPMEGPCCCRCHEGRGYCMLYPGREKPGKCFVGVLGWLGSCRQAYTETIPILYAKNTIHLTSVPLITNLPRLIPPAHLSLVTSLEIFCPLHLFPMDESPSDAITLENLDAILVSLSSNFPSLRKLYLLLGDPVPPSIIRWARDYHAPFPTGYLQQLDEVLVRVDALVREIGGPQLELELAPPDAVFRPFVERAKKEGDAGGHVYFEMTRRWPRRERAWRGVSVSIDEVGEDRAAKGLGYWIRRGIHPAHVPC